MRSYSSCDSGSSSSSSTNRGDSFSASSPSNDGRGARPCADERKEVVGRRPVRPSVLLLVPVQLVPATAPPLSAARSCATPQPRTLHVVEPPTLLLQPEMYRRLRFVRSAPRTARGPLRGSAAGRGGADRVYLCGFATWPGTTCSKRQPSPREQTPRCANWKQAWRGTVRAVSALDVGGASGARRAARGAPAPVHFVQPDAHAACRRRPRSPAPRERAWSRAAREEASRRRRRPVVDAPAATWRVCSQPGQWA